MTSAVRAGFTEDDVPDRSGRTFLVTGANTGIGFEVARALAGRNARVLLGCRDEGKARAAMEAIRASVPGADLAFVPLDLADLDQVRRAADHVAQTEPRLDVLVNNAGVMFPPLTRTKQGHELQFGVNHLGGFALSGLLLPKLSEAPNARIVITASIAHRRGTVNWDDIDAHASYRPTQRYADSKLMNLLHAFELDRRLRAAGSPVASVACHPGVAATELVRHLPKIAKLAWPVMCRFTNTAAQGAWPALQAATAPGVSSGDYYGSQGFREARGVSGPATCSPAARDTIAAARLWDLSAGMTGVDYGGI